MKVGKASGRAKFRRGHPDSWYRSLLLCILADTGSEKGRLLSLLMALGLPLGRGTSYHHGVSKLCLVNFIQRKQVLTTSMEVLSVD